MLNSIIDVASISPCPTLLHGHYGRPGDAVRPGDILGAVCADAALELLLRPPAVRRGRGGIDNMHSTDVESTNRVRADVCAFTLKVSHEI